MRERSSSISMKLEQKTKERNVICHRSMQTNDKVNRWNTIWTRLPTRIAGESSVDGNACYDFEHTGSKFVETTE